MNIQEIESFIRAGIQEAMAEGWQIGCKEFGSFENKCGCALTLAFRNDPNVIDPAISCDIAHEKFGYDMWPFMWGFDGNEMQRYYGSEAMFELFELGKRFREEYKPKRIHNGVIQHE